MRVEVVGGGVVGLCVADILSRRGAAVRLIAASDGPDQSCCSWWAGGMLAPNCEMEAAPPLIGVLGAESIAYWRTLDPAPVFNGTLVVAAPRDLPDLKRFSARTSGWRALDGAGVAALEPDLADRFHQALFYPDEAHLDPRGVLLGLVARCRAQGVDLQFGRRLEGVALDAPGDDVDYRIDCRGLASRDRLSDLRPVRGEMLILRCRDVQLARPVRLLHPRIPIYIVPRADGVFMVGATMIEGEKQEGAAARSILELLSATYAVHPGFGEATILEIGADARPGFIDHLPKLRRRGRTLHVNGMYRHGYLGAPAMARRAADYLFEGTIFPEVMDEEGMDAIDG